MVREVDPSERERAVAVQVTAFVRDPVMRHVYPEAEHYLRHHPTFVQAFGGLAFERGTAYVAGDFGGVAMWIPPGAHVDGGPIETLLRESVRAQALDDGFALLEQMAAYHIEEPHWYLAILGVDPRHQGRGIGSALLGKTLERCDEERLPAYLESSNPANIPLYERHGFEVQGEIRAGDWPPVYPMLRPAR
jgi:GNAT superfamily N-acetyltransferase